MLLHVLIHACATLQDSQLCAVRRSVICLTHPLPLPPTTPSHPRLPQILYHPMSRHFILMFHLDTPNFEAPAVGVATAPNITGTGMRGAGLGVRRGLQALWQANPWRRGAWP